MRPGRLSRTAFLLAAVLLAGIVTLVSPAAAQEPGEALRVFHVVAGPGDQVWERFGHNAIWIHDPERGRDPTYNYGIFDFDQENFILRFVQGRMLYSMAPFPIESTVEIYRRDNRLVTVQELNLTPAERLRLYEFLEWNALPENRDYRYDYFHDNCSTRVRDALDHALGGQIREQTGHVPSGTTFRSHSRRLVGDDLPLYLGIHAGLGPATDREISVWEEMFIPMRLEDHLRAITVADAEGNRQPLVLDERVVVPSGRALPPDSPPSHLALLLGIGILAGGVLAALGMWGRWRSARVGLAVLGGVWGFVTGIGGLLLLGLWLLTDHTAAHANANLFNLTPLGLALAALVPAAVRGRAGRWALWVAAAVIGIALLGLLLRLTPLVNQATGEIIALTLPIHIGLCLGLLLLERVRVTRSST